MAKLSHLKNHINAIGKRGHYESWMAEFSGEGIDDPMVELDDVTMEQYKQAFTQSSFKEEIAKFFPLIHSIMSEADAVDLEDYVEEAVEEKCNECGMWESKCSCDEEVKENAFAAFENWAEAVEQGKLSPEQIKELKAAIEAMPEGSLQLDTAYNFFNEYGINSDELENAFQQEASRSEELRAEPIEVFKAWSKENYPELAVALGISDTEAPAEQPAPAEPAPVEPAPEEPVAEAPEDRTSYQVAKILAGKGVTYDPSNEGELVKAIGMVLVKELNMSPKEARNLISYDEDFLGDTMSELKYMEQDSTDETSDNGEMEQDKGSMVQEVAKIVKSFYNRDNPNVGPFRGEEGIAIDVEKTISEKFGDQAGQQARELAEKFMEKLTTEWQSRHGQTRAVEPTDGLARLKELVGNIKTKVEGIGDQGQGGRDFNTNIMSAEQGTAEGLGVKKTELAMAYLMTVVMAPVGTPEKRRILNWQQVLADKFDIEMDTAVLAQMLPQLDSQLKSGQLDKLQNRMASRGELEIGETQQGVSEGKEHLARIRKLAGLAK
jgi:hypothetical protein